MRERDIFIEALQQSDPARRAALLDEVCQSDAALRTQVERLLAEHERQESFILDTPPAGLDATALYRPLAERPGSVIGPYKLLQQIGEGGMGVVFMAEQTEPLQRTVALKIIKPGMDTRQVIARFEAERQALAMMDHPNIAKVLDAGTTDSGRPYFVMELVKGVPITQYCDEKRLPLRARLELLVPVCQAVQHAHQKGVIHRDIKPSNVLVAEYDDQAVPKVIDFGVAKATAQKLTERTMFTEFGQVVGTVEYMSPEQAKLNQLDIDTRSDVYSLGVLLYELLTGSTPFGRKRLQEAAFDEMLRIIREEEPPKPSTRLSTAEGLPSIAANRGSEPLKLNRLVRGELDWVVMKALEKDRNRRYETAIGIAADIQRYLDGDPVWAAPPSARYLLWKFVRRHKGQVIAAGLVLFALLVGIAGTTWGLLEAKKQERIAIAAQGEEALARQREALRADAEANQRQRADEEKQRAIRFRDQALDALRATTGADVEKLVGSKTVLSKNERDYLEAIAQRWQGFAKQSGTDVETREYQIEGHFRVAYLWRKLGRRDEARAEFQAAFVLQEKLAEQFPAVPGYQQDLAATRNNLGHLLKDLGKSQEAWEEYLSALVLQTKLVEQFPAAPEYQQNLADTRNHLGILLADLGKREEARAEFQSARDLQKKLLRQFPAETDYQAGLARTHNNLGNLFSNLGKGEEARAEYQSARDLHQKLVEQFPTMPEYQENLGGACNNLGILLASLGKNEEAQAEYQSSLDLRKKLVEQFPSVCDYQESLALTHFNVGNLFRDLGKREEARAEFQAARDLHKKLVEQFPTTPKYQQDLAGICNNLGTLLASLGKNDQAQAEYQSSLELQKKLVEQFPTVPAYQVELALAHFSLGNLFRDLGKSDQAQAKYQATLDLQKKLVAQFPTVPNYQRDLALTHNNLGNLLTNLKKPEEARTEYRSALDLQKKLVEQFPAVASYQIDLGGSYCNYAILVSREGGQSESLQWFDRAIRTLQPVYESEARDITAKEFLRNSYWSRGQAYNYLQKNVEALEDWDQVIALSPPDEQLELRATRATLRFRAGMVAEAIADLSESTKSDKWTAEQWYDFACIYSVASGKFADKKQEYADRAMELLHKAVRTGFNRGAHMAKDSDLDLLHSREDFRKLLVELDEERIAILRKAADAGTLDPQVFTLLGEHYAEQEQWKAAATAFAQACELDAADPGLTSRAAVTALAAGDDDGYRRVCRQALDRFAETDDPVVAHQTANAGLLAAEPGGDLTQLAKLADFAVTNGKDHAWLPYFQLLRAMAAYRTGDWAGTLDWCGRSRTSGGSKSSLATLLLLEAMAHHQLKHAAQARAALDQATTLMEEHFAGAQEDRAAQWKYWLTCQIVRREAEELLKQESGVGEQGRESTENPE